MIIQNKGKRKISVIVDTSETIIISKEQAPLTFKGALKITMPKTIQDMHQLTPAQFKEIKKMIDDKVTEWKLYNPTFQAVTDGRKG